MERLACTQNQETTPFLALLSFGLQYTTWAAMTVCLTMPYMYRRFNSQPCFLNAFGIGSVLDRHEGRYAHAH